MSMSQAEITYGICHMDVSCLQCSQSQQRDKVHLQVIKIGFLPYKNSIEIGVIAIK